MGKEFSVSNLYGNGGATISPSLLPSPTPDEPLWLQIVSGIRQVDSILDRYIFTEEERARMELERLRFQVEQEKARQASIQPTTTPWVWALVAVGVGAVLAYLLLRE